MNLNEIIDENDFKGYLKELVSLNYLEGTALGIAKQVITKGVNSLTDKQKYVFQNEVIDKYVKDYCERCSNSIPWSEMSIAHETGFCGWCQHQFEKLQND